MRPEDLVEQTLGHYKIKRQIGYGGMATVFLAEDIHLGREVALKVFWPRPGETQDFLRRFTREARVLAQLDHPNILPVYDYGEQGELAFLVIPYMAGGSLKELLQKRKALPPSEAIQLISQVLPALQYAHDRNLIHRDIKPGNLLFKSDGSMIVADFGLVKVLEGVPLRTISETGQSIAGTPEYMSPEQIDGRSVPASDIYSLGIVLYEMVTGTRPFTGANLLSVLLKHANEAARSPRELNPYVSPRLEAVILKALEKDPHKRFARPADFLQALQQTSAPASQFGSADLAIQAYIPGQPAPGSAQDISSEYTTIATNWSQEPGGPAHGASGPNAPTIAGNQPPQVYGPGTPSALTVAGSQPNWQPVQTPPQPQTPAQRPASQPGFPASGNPAPPFPTLNPTLPVAQSPQPVQAWAPAQTIMPPFIPQQPRPSRAPLAVFIVLCVLLVGVIASLFITPLGARLLGRVTATAITTPAAGIQTTTPGTTEALAKTSTSCPTGNSARAAVMATLARGNDPIIVYIVNEKDASNNPTFGTVKIFNTVNGKKKELAKTNNTEILEAQVSNDGQWVLFSALVAGRSELRLVRLDGQGLQTLLCAPAGVTIKASQWSIDQRYIIFDEFPPNGGEPAVYLLNAQSGALQVEVTPPTSGYALIARTWLDNSRVLMIGMVPYGDSPQQYIYILNLANGAHQKTADMTPIFTSTTLPCWDFDSSYDAQSLFVTQCTQSGGNISSTISRLPINGNAASIILTNPTLGFSTVRVIDTASAQLLALGSGTSNGQTTEGLYVINTNSSGSPFLLTSINVNDGSFGLNYYSQYYWSNVSRNHTMYALATTKGSANTPEYIISYGLLSGGTPTTFVDYNQYLAVAGWTTI